MQVNFSNIRVVLVNTSHPGNIGSVARAMKNMFLTDLWLVSPEEFPHGKARAMASSATDILHKAKVVNSLDEALVGCGLVFGASARLRSIAWATVDPRQCAEMVASASTQNQIALVMGREDSGLTNEELERCNYLVHIPANPDYSSLNLAMAVQVLAYEIRMQALEDSEAGTEDDFGLDEFRVATADEMEGLYAHFASALEKLDFYDPANPRQLMRRLRRLFNRSRVDTMELNILRGILSAAENAVSDNKKNDTSR